MRGVHDDGRVGVVFREVLDEPGQGGASHEYVIHWPASREGIDEQSTPPNAECRISFQNGPIKEVGLNGITQEALLAIAIDRLRSFQAGPFASDYNKQALFHCEVALDWLQKRTRDRLVRGVEGTNAK